MLRSRLLLLLKKKNMALERTESRWGNCHDVESAAWDAPAYLDGGAYVGLVFCVGEPDDVVDLKF